METSLGTVRIAWPNRSWLSAWYRSLLSVLSAEASPGHSGDSTALYGGDREIGTNLGRNCGGMENGVELAFPGSSRGERSGATGCPLTWTGGSGTARKSQFNPVFHTSTVTAEICPNFPVSSIKS